MRTRFSSAVSALFLLLTFSLSINAKSIAATLPNDGHDKLSFTVNIPEGIQPEIVRQDFGNESLFSFKNGSNNAFLFSVTRVSAEQWLKVKDQVSHYTIIENKDNYITFVQKTDQAKIKGSGNDGYQKVYVQLDNIIGSIHLN